jgi:hypothetical protein
MGKYDSKGTYAGYNKNNKERAEGDFYATPPEEVTNILNQLNIEFLGWDTVLDPCYGACHMLKGFVDYLNENNRHHDCFLIGTDIKDRGSDKFNNAFSCRDIALYADMEKGDFLNPNYKVPSVGAKSDPEGRDQVDYVIMNPPFSTLEYFINKGYDLAKKGLLVLCRLQALETKSRYENIFKDTPPSDVYIYVDRITCAKNGDETTKGNGVQAYCWLWWNKLGAPKRETKLHWITSAKYKK